MPVRRPAVSVLLALAMATAGAIPAAAVANPNVRPPDQVRRGTVAWFYAATTAPDAIYPVYERIFDGERWIMLLSEAGWRLYIESRRSAADSE